MVITQSRLKALIREMEFQLRRIRWKIEKKGLQEGLRESYERCQQILLILLALQKGEQLEIITPPSCQQTEEVNANVSESGNK